MKKNEWNKLADNEYRELYRRWMGNPEQTSNSYHTTQKLDSPVNRIQTALASFHASSLHFVFFKRKTRTK